MDKKSDLIGSVNWDTILPNLLNHSDLLIRKHYWRGAPVKAAKGRIALADGRDAQDYVHDAVQTILDPESRRKWDIVKEPNIEEHLKSVISSMVSNASRLVENRDTRRQFAEGHTPDNSIDLVGTAADPRPAPDVQVPREETLAHQREVLQRLRKAAEGDPELTLLLDAYDAEITKPQEIEELTGIPAPRVSELKRKLRELLERIDTPNGQNNNYEETP